MFLWVWLWSVRQGHRPWLGLCTIYILLNNIFLCESRYMMYKTRPLSRLGSCNSFHLSWSKSKSEETSTTYRASHKRVGYGKVVSFFISQVSNDFQQRNWYPLEDYMNCSFLEYNTFSDKQKLTEIGLVQKVNQIWFVFSVH